MPGRPSDDESMTSADSRAASIIDGTMAGPVHAIPADDVLRAQATRSDRGLDAAEAHRRLQRHGPNTLPPPARRGPLLRFLLQFNDILIYVLLVAGVVTGVLGHLIDSGVIF